MARLNIPTGTKYGQLTVIGDAPMVILPSGQHSRHMTCQCDCGKFVIVCLNSLRKGTSKSCGCSKGENHGDSNSKLYRNWCSMKNRCYLKSTKSYHNYGGRGITICDEWKDSYTTFRDWSLANGYEHGLEIDRIDNDANYEPSNCRYVTPWENSNNRRTNIMVELNGETLPLQIALQKVGRLKEWSAIRQRMKKLGWSFEEAIAAPRYCRKEKALANSIL